MYEHPVILFDGVCNFCNRSINILIRSDKKKIFRFALLQSEKGKELLEKYRLSLRHDSFVLIYKGKAYQRSSASLIVFSLMQWYWQWTQIFWLVPRFIRDGAYNIIARNRYRWFGKKDQCVVPGPDIISRFL